MECDVNGGDERDTAAELKPDGRRETEYRAKKKAKFEAQSGPDFSLGSKKVDLIAEASPSPPKRI